MKAILLDGSYPNDLTGQRVRRGLAAQLEARGWQVQTVLLRDAQIGNCAGDFFCWVRTPGLCNVNDDNREIAKAIVHSDLLVYLTPITFGGYSSVLKQMVDHQIQNVSPFFEQIAGETHHQRRYRKYASFLAIGWMEQPDPQSELIFRRLAQRNAINFHARKSSAVVVTGDTTEAELQSSIQSALDQLEGRTTSRRQGDAGLPITEPGAGRSPIRTALLLVGSPRTRKSTSHSLGSYLLEQLNAQQVATRTIFIHTSIRSKERMNTLLEAVEAADLVLLASPLYVDSLPAPVTEALERITARRASPAGRHPNDPQLFAAISNCGFPEPAHNATALAICANFARLAGFQWAGSLALGAGEGMIHGASLHDLDGRVIPLKKALDLAAAALAEGQPIPLEAQNLLARPFVPAWLYRWMGIYGWRQQAKPYGMQSSLKRRPYAVK